MNPVILEAHEWCFCLNPTNRGRCSSTSTGHWWNLRRSPTELWWRRNSWRCYVGFVHDWAAPWQGVSYQVEIYLLLAACRLGYRVLEVPTTKIYPSDGRPYSKAAPVDWFRMVKPLVWTLLRLDRPRGPRRAPGRSSGVVRVQ